MIGNFHQKSLSNGHQKLPVSVTSSVQAIYSNSCIVKSRNRHHRTSDSVWRTEIQKQILHFQSLHSKWVNFIQSGKTFFPCTIHLNTSNHLDIQIVGTSLDFSSYCLSVLRFHDFLSFSRYNGRKKHTLKYRLNRSRPKVTNFSASD